MKQKNLIAIAAIVVGGYMLFFTTSADGNSPLSDFGNLLSSGSGVTIGDIGFTGWAGVAAVAYGVYQLV